MPLERKLLNKSEKQKKKLIKKKVEVHGGIRLTKPIIKS